MVKLIIDGLDVEACDGATVLEAAKQAGIKIPTLCYSRHLLPYGGCRICLVEIEMAGGMRKSVSSCTYPVQEGLKVFSATEKIREQRRFIIQLLLSRNQESDELKELAREIGFSPDDESGFDEIGTYLFKRKNPEKYTKCILCGLCVRVCMEVTRRYALTFAERGAGKMVKTPFNKISKTCIGCGACAYLCPTGAITVEQADE